MSLLDFPPTKSKKSFSENERLAWLRLIRTENIGAIAFYNLLARFGSASEALRNLPNLAKRGGRLKNYDVYPEASAEQEIRALEKAGGQFIYSCEEIYPLALSALSDAPPVLSVMGNTKLLDKPGVGIVGARNASLNGRKFAEILARDLGNAGQVIISGLARGIDTSAHQGSIETGTIAVVAGGIDIIYPEENKALYEQIKQMGLIVAEDPFGQRPFAQSFPKRNRIISGLSAGIIVVEASLRSGSLITARLAGEQGRDVFAVPGFPLDPRAQGPNKLLQDGAILVQNSEDVLSHLANFARHSPRSFREPIEQDHYSVFDFDETQVDAAHDLIVSKLSDLPVGIDEILRDCALTPAVFNSALLDLEIGGQITRHAGGKIALLR
jgi:DNA processing protein